MAEPTKVPSGVQELIGRLRDEGVKAGRQEAERILQEAQKQAAQIVAQANAEAEEIKNQAHSQATTERAAFQEAVKVAFRDTRLKLESEIRAAFTAHVKRLVSVEMEDRDFLRKCLLLIIGYATDGLSKDQPLEILIADKLFVREDDRPRLTAEGEQRLRHLVLGISGEMLREGIELKPASDIHGGLRVRLMGEDLEIDLRDRALADLLLKFLLPKFRSIAEGLE
jgi:V/A-type H+-transporting ATPase subunit E